MSSVAALILLLAFCSLPQNTRQNFTSRTEPSPAYPGLSSDVTAAPSDSTSVTSNRWGSDGRSTEDTPTDGRSTEDTPTIGHSTEDTPTKGHSTDDAPTIGHSTEDTPTKGHSTDDTPTIGHSTEDTPTIGHSTEDTPTKGHSTEDTPTEGHSTEETPTKGHSTDDTPTEGHTTKDTPTKGHSTEDTPTDVRSITDLSCCPCDITPGVCDIGCCCDTTDCGSSDLSTVFTGCVADDRGSVCAAGGLALRVNVDPALLCTQTDEGVAPYPAPLRPLPAPRQPTPLRRHARGFYQVDDPLLIRHSGSSPLSVLLQPRAGPSSACVRLHPARFLRSGSHSCSITLTPRACVEHPDLQASSYSSFSLLSAPAAGGVSERLVPVSLASEQPRPQWRDGWCLNVVSEVEYVLEFSVSGEIGRATLMTRLTNASSGAWLQQRHTLTFKPLDAAARGPAPPAGLPPGAPLTGWVLDRALPLTVLGTADGSCSSGLADRTPVLMGRNLATGCLFRSAAEDCDAVRAELMRVLVGVALPERVAVTAGDTPERSRVLVGHCPQSSACSLPVSLSLRLLWARRGGASLPQTHLLAAKYSFSCRRVMLPVRAPLAVTAEVLFSDITVHPPRPAQRPHTHWRFPFSFLSRGTAEIDQLT